MLHTVTSTKKSSSTPRIGYSEPSDDPIHAALERHLAAVHAHDAAVGEYNKVEALIIAESLSVASALSDKRLRRCERAVEAATKELDRAAIALAKTVPTSWAGLFDTLIYLRDAGDPDMFWPSHPKLGLSYAQVMYDSLQQARFNIREAEKPRHH